ncbi:hypothetical protein H0H93_009215 [Arthromyces matolae]|nr:hypothetical protein H0H93_009215 [Arthromyces matolae]
MSNVNTLQFPNDHGGQNFHLAIGFMLPFPHDQAPLRSQASELVENMNAFHVSDVPSTSQSAHGHGQAGEPVAETGQGEALGSIQLEPPYLHRAYSSNDVRQAVPAANGDDRIQLDPPFRNREGNSGSTHRTPSDRAMSVDPQYRNEEATPTEVDEDQFADDERNLFLEEDDGEEENPDSNQLNNDLTDIRDALRGLSNQTADLQRRIDQGFHQRETSEIPPENRRRRGALALRVTPKLTKNAIRRGNEAKKLAENVRQHLARLVGKDNLLIPSVTPAEASTWKCNVEAFGEDFDGACCTSSQFRYHLLGPPRHPWNRSAAKVFAADYMRHHQLPATMETAELVIGAFYTRLKTLRRKYFTRVHVVTPVDPQRLRRDQRKRTLFNRRLEVAQIYPFLQRHVRLIQQLGVDGMSSDESDHEEAIHNNTVGSRRPRYEVILPPWRAVELSRWLHVFDSLYSVARRSLGPSRGDHPRIRHYNPANIRFSVTNSFVTHLPGCLYRAEWLTERSPQFIDWTLQPSTAIYPLVHDNDVVE